MAKRVSKLLDEHGRPFLVNVTPRPNASYDAAKTSDENKKHWANADAMSARQANSPGVRQVLRNRHRYSYDNDPYYGGMIRTLATDLHGTGARLQSQIPDNDRANLTVELRFGEWCNAVGLTQELLVASESKLGSEALILLRKDENVPVVPLNIQLIEGEQCATPLSAIPKDLSRWVDGIELDARNKPVAYHILREHPGDQLTRIGEFERVPADQVIHIFRRNRPGQHRGVPECTASLSVGAQRQRWGQATLVAAECAAEFAVLITSKLPLDFNDDDLPSEWETMELHRGMITTLPAGGDAHQMKAEHPNQEYAPFKHELLKEMGRPVGAPYSIVGMDGSEHNYSSLRYEREVYLAAMRVERELWRWTVLDRIFKAWYTLARMIPGYLSPAGEVLPEIIPFGWYWPGFAAIDPLKEAVADTERLSNGTSNLQEILAEYGQDYRVFLKQRARERDLFIELGLPLPVWLDPAAAKTPSGAANAANAQDQNAAIRLALLSEKEDAG